MLFENHRRKQRRLQAMRRAVADDAAKAAQRGAAARFVVVWQVIEEALHLKGSAKPGEDTALRGQEIATPRPAGRWRKISSRRQRS